MDGYQDRPAAPTAGDPRALLDRQWRRPPAPAGGAVGSQLEDFLVVAVAIAFLTGLPVANRHDETAESGGYTLVWYLLAGAVVSSLAAVSVLSEYRALAVLFGVTLFVGGVVIGLSRLYGI